MTENEKLVDAAIAHQVDIVRYANGLEREQVGQLNSGDEELLALLLAALLSIPEGQRTPARVDAALAPVLAANAATYSTISRSLEASLTDAVRTEADYQLNTFSKTAQEPPRPVDSGAVAAAMLATPMIGATIRDSVAGLASARAQAIRRTVLAGVVAGQSTDEIVRAVRGTWAAQFSDGVLAVARSNLATVVRSAATHAFEFVRAAFFALNGNIVRSVVWISVLDSATSSWCIARAGKRYTAVDHKPIGHNYDWGAGPGRYHYNCRSTFAPLVAGEVPNVPTFGEWLKRQDAKTQDEVLGPTRGRMYRSGQVGVEGFLNNKGKLLSLEQLRAKGIEP